MRSEDIVYCPKCGTKVVLEEVSGRNRKVCARCSWIFFPDPKVAAAVLIEQDSQVLLVRRAVNPARGLWALPAGYVDAGEDPVRAAERECGEETGLNVTVVDLIDVVSGPEKKGGADIILYYRAEVVSGSLHPGDDVDKAAFFPRNSLPPIAFSSIERILSGL